MIYFDYKCVCKNCGYVFRRGLLDKCCFDPVGEIDLKKCNANEMPYNCTLCAIVTDKLKSCKPNHYYIPEEKYCLCNECKREELPNLDREAFEDEDAYYSELEKLYKEKVEKLRNFEFKKEDFKNPIDDEFFPDTKYKATKTTSAFRQQKKEQKEAFYNIICSLGVEIKKEIKITQITNKPYMGDKIYKVIHKKLFNHAKERESDTAKKYPNDYNPDEYYKKINSISNIPKTDYWIPSKNLIIEYDEDQHFTKARKLTLESYPDDLILEFSTRKWMNCCDQINAKHKPYRTRDEQRAYYDSVRDIEAAVNGISIIRVRHGAFDWINSSKEEIKKELVKLRIIKRSDKC